MNREEKKFSALDNELARFLLRYTHLTGADKNRFCETIKELSYQLMEGHSCIVVDDDIRAIVRASGVASTTSRAPLILEDNRLYLHRYWHYESRLARQIKTLCEQQNYPEASEAALDRYFPSIDHDEPDWQKEAARSAMTRGFSILTGGPGTGKTTTIVKIVALLLEFSDTTLHIALAAPTGKAAMRLKESIGQAKSTIPCSNPIKKRFPDTVTTIHRLLGPRPSSPYFRHHAGNPLPHDLVVIDEASMVDLALMSKLADALKPNARLILLGDKDQLASVESGAVLLDLAMALPEHTLKLEKSHRFDENIKALADAVNRQQSVKAWNILQSEDAGNVGLLRKDPIEYIAEKRVAYLSLIKSNADFIEISRAFQSFQVLATNRRGKNSVEDLNYSVEQRLTEKGWISPEAFWYPGRPVLVTQNDGNMQLFNGDIGICLLDREYADRVMVFFERPDGSVKKILPARLPHFETVFAMTVHKSQGSEFKEVLVVMPEVMNPILTKELLYTAITRAKKEARLVTTQAVFSQTLRQNVTRYSGLVEKIIACP